MAKNNLTQLSIKDIVSNQLLYSKIRTLMEQQKSYDYIIAYLNSKGYSISKGSLTNLKHKVEESIKEGKNIVELADKREKNSIDDIPDNKIVGFIGRKQPAVSGKVSKLYSEDQILEKIMEKGVKTIEESDFIEPKVLMKAVELHAKYFGTKTRGLTSEGLKQYQLIMQARDTAMQQVFFQYIPKDKQEEALQALEKESDRVLRQIGVTKEGKELLKQLRKADLPLK